MIDVVAGIAIRIARVAAVFVADHDLQNAVAVMTKIFVDLNGVAFLGEWPPFADLERNRPSDIDHASGKRLTGFAHLWRRVR